MFIDFISQISELFGGMEVCGLSIIVSKDGREHILGASDSTFPLMGDTQEEDRRQIADLVCSRMQVIQLFYNESFNCDFLMQIWHRIECLSARNDVKGDI